MRRPPALEALMALAIVPFLILMFAMPALTEVTAGRLSSSVARGSALATRLDRPKGPAFADQGRGCVEVRPLHWRCEVARTGPGRRRATATYLVRINKRTCWNGDLIRSAGGPMPPATGSCVNWWKDTVRRAL
jgi:hypothetical protein